MGPVIILRAAALLVGAALPLLLARAASACAVCLGGEGANAAAFVWTTALLGLLPLVMIGGGIYWLFSRASSIGSEEERSGAPARAVENAHSFEPARAAEVGARPAPAPS
jgi:hypothetical protein